MIDRAEIFRCILAKNALRREALLPLLDVRQIYEREIKLARWLEHVEEHGERVRAEVLRSHRIKYGSDYPSSAGGRWAINALTWKALEASFRSP